MKVIIAGGTGMVGQIVLNCAMQDEKIREIISLVRKPTSTQHPKLNEVVIKDFENYDDQKLLFQYVTSAFFCIGVYTGQVKEDLFKKITVDYAVQFATAVHSNSPNASFCLLSGAGADRSERSRTSFARFKGMAENQISQLDLNFYTLRPGYIYPVEKRVEPNMLYNIFRGLYPVLRLFGKNTSIKSTELGQAMYNIGINGAKQEVLENRDILEYA